MRRLAYLVVFSSVLGCSSGAPREVGSRFVCGTSRDGGAPLTCSHGEECFTPNDVDFQCDPLPEACQVQGATCACYGDLSPCSCHEDAAGNLLVVCG